MTRENNHLPLSREEKARPSGVNSTLSWTHLQIRCGAGRTGNQPRRMCVCTKPSPNALGSAHRLCLCCRRRETFHKGAVFQRTTNAAILNLGMEDCIWTVYTSKCWLIDIESQCLWAPLSKESKGTCFWWFLKSQQMSSLVVLNFATQAEIPGWKS